MGSVAGRPIGIEKFGQNVAPSIVIKPRTGWGYETLVKEVSDSHLSAPLLFDGAPASGSPDESTAES